MKPKKEFKVGLIKAAVFEREAQGKSGKFVSQSVSLQQSYKKDGEWKNPSLTIVKKNLANTIKVLQKAAVELGVAFEAIPDELVDSNSEVI